jgi:hypothetical protein
MNTTHLRPIVGYLPRYAFSRRLGWTPPGSLLTGDGLALVKNDPDQIVAGGVVQIKHGASIRLSGPEGNIHPPKSEQLLLAQLLAVYAVQ